MLRAARPLGATAAYLETVGLGGLVSAVAAKARGTHAVVRVARADCEHPLWLRVPTSDVQAYRQVFIHREYDFATEKPPAAIVDAGANIGMTSVFFANRFPDARIIAIEPEQGNFELLTRNAAPYPQISCVRAALWDRNEEIDLVDPGLGNWGFMTIGRNRPGEDGLPRMHSVAGMTVDRIMRDHGLPRIDILKVDIEGAEREVFNDTSLWIDHVDSIIAELHERLKPGCESSFYRGATGFVSHWEQGEHVCLSRPGRIAPAHSDAMG